MKASFAAILAAVATCADPIMATTTTGIIQHDDGNGNCWYVQANNYIGLKTCDRSDVTQLFSYDDGTRAIHYNSNCVEASDFPAILVTTCSGSDIQKWTFNGAAGNAHLHTDDSRCARKASNHLLTFVGCIGSAKGANPELEFVFLGPTAAPTTEPSASPSLAPSAAPSLAPSEAPVTIAPTKPVTGSSSGDPHCKFTMLLLPLACTSFLLCLTSPLHFSQDLWRQEI